MKTLEEINARLAEIKKLLEDPNADVDALQKETEELLAAKKKLEDEQKAAGEGGEEGRSNSNITRRGALMALIGGAEGQVIRGLVGADGAGVNISETHDAQYRSAFLNQLRNIDLSREERSALSTASSSAGAVVPTQTMNKIIEKVNEYAPLLGEIDLLHVAGNVKVPAEGTTTDAALHTENATITGDADTMGYVELGMYEITKLVTISKSVQTMSIDAFENWLAKKIGRKIADKITSYIINGTGSSQPQGVNAITWGTTNSVTVAKTTALSESNLDTVVGLLNGGYDNGAKWIMSKKTFFGDVRPIQDKSKNDVVVKDGKTWYVEGYEVMFDDRVTIHEAILGNFNLGYLGNMAEDVNVTSQFVVRENSFDFMGCAMFDGKVQATEAFVKIVKATA